jgi:hypothetical protein
MLETASHLSEPGEPNNEYIRGQVNLIEDFFGLAGYDDVYYIIAAAIMGKTTPADAVKTICKILDAKGRVNG